MAQRKITAPVEAAELPDLEPRDQEFVRLVVSGKTATDAFRATRDCADWQPSSVWARASQLRNDGKVQAWIDAAKLAGMSNCAVTYASHIEELERLKTIAVKTGNIGAAVQAEQIRGKAAGLHIDKVQDVTPVDTVQTLKDIAQASPELAAQLAAQHGIEWATPADATKH